MIRVENPPENAAAITVEFNGQDHEIEPGEALEADVEPFFVYWLSEGSGRRGGASGPTRPMTHPRRDVKPARSAT